MSSKVDLYVLYSGTQALTVPVRLERSENTHLYIDSKVTFLHLSSYICTLKKMFIWAWQMRKLTAKGWQKHTLKCTAHVFYWQVVGSQARILYSDQVGRIRIAEAFNNAVKDGKLKVWINVLCYTRIQILNLIIMLSSLWHSAIQSNVGWRRWDGLKEGLLLNVWKYRGK